MNVLNEVLLGNISCTSFEKQGDVVDFSLTSGLVKLFVPESGRIINVRYKYMNTAYTSVIGIPANREVIKNCL